MSVGVDQCEPPGSSRTCGIDQLICSMVKLNGIDCSMHNSKIESTVACTKLDLMQRSMHKSSVACTKSSVACTSSSVACTNLFVHATLGLDYFRTLFGMDHFIFQRFLENRTIFERFFLKTYWFSLKMGQIRANMAKFRVFWAKIAVFWGILWEIWGKCGNLARHLGSCVWHVGQNTGLWPMSWAISQVCGTYLGQLLGKARKMLGNEGQTNWKQGQTNWEQWQISRKWAILVGFGHSSFGAQGSRAKPHMGQPCAREFLSSSAEGPKGP